MAQCSRPNRLRMRRSFAVWANPARAFGVTTLLVFLACALTPTALLPYSPVDVDLSKANQPGFWDGNWRQPLGTDFLGRDLLSRAIYATRLTLGVSISAVVVATAFGSVLGLLAGYYGGWIDELVSWLIEVQLAFPMIALAVAVIAVVGGSFTSLVAVLAATSWFTTARVVRSQALVLRSTTYLEAARALGVGRGRLLLRHLLPNVGSAILAVATFEIARLVLTESALSVLGLGIAPPNVTWGSMIGDGRSHLYDSWWTATVPGILIALLVIAFNFVGDELRDVVDPETMPVPRSGGESKSV